MKNITLLFDNINNILLEDTVNDLISGWQAKWLLQKNKFGKGYKDLTDDEKKELNKYLEELKEKYIKYVNEITDNKEYRSWVFKLLKNLKIRLPEDSVIMKELLEQYTILKRNPNFKDKEILKFKSYGDLAEIIDNFTLKHQSKITNIGKNKVILVDGNFKVLELTNYEDSVHLLKPTKWCVKHIENFEDYLYTIDDYYDKEENEIQPFYLFLKDDKQYALVHFGSNQLKDVYNKPFEKIDKEFEEVLSKIINQYSNYHSLDMIGELSICFNDSTYKHFNTDNISGKIVDAVNNYNFDIIKKIIDIGFFYHPHYNHEELLKLLIICIENYYVKGVEEIFGSKKFIISDQKVYNFSKTEDDDINKALSQIIEKDEFEKIVKILLENDYKMKSNIFLYNIAKHCIFKSNISLLDHFLTIDKRPDFIGKDDKRPVTIELIRNARINEHEKDYVKVYEVLFKHGAEIDYKMKNETSFIEYVCRMERNEITQLILKEPKLNPNPLIEQSPLMIATKYLNYNFVKMALDSNRFFVNHVDQYGNTALHYLFIKRENMSKYVYTETMNILELLFKHGANPNIKNKEGKTVFDVADHACRLYPSICTYMEKYKK